MVSVTRAEGRIIRDVTRPPRDLIDRLASISTSIVADCLQRFQVMDSSVQPLVPGTRMCGPAVTAEEIEGGNLMSHFALELLQRGDVLVVAAKGCTTRATWGGLQTFAAARVGAAGIVIDGAIRDRGELPAHRVPVFARAVTAAGPHKGWGGNINLPISCAGVVVSPGDVVLGDDDGVVVVPRDRLEEIIEKSARREAMEREWFRRVEQGETTVAVLEFRKKLDEFKLEVL